MCGKIAITSGNTILFLGFNSMTYDIKENRVPVLSLSDGNAWQIVAGDKKAAAIVARLEEIMQLRPLEIPHRRLSLITSNKSGSRKLTSGDVEVFVPSLDEFTLKEISVQLLQPIFQDIEECGGLFIHSALAERNGFGVILPGPSGIGKTTAINRLPFPWESLCDDETFVAPDIQGRYWAHPWPTWYNFGLSDPKETWNVNYAIPLRGIFFLTRSRKDWIKPIDAKEAVGMLVEIDRQAAPGWLELPGTEKKILRDRRLMRFENVCALAKSVPSFVLSVSPTGRFWENINFTLGLNNKI